MGEAEAAGAPRDLLLATKLVVPPSRPGRVARPRLLRRLRAATGQELVLVCAPAGFGKSTLLADWVGDDGRIAAWLSLDQADNDPVRFWRHIAAAVDAARPGVAQRAGVLVGGPGSTSVMAAVTALVNDLASAQQDLLLVVDDYHVIQTADVHRSLTFLLDHLPAPLCLALAGRSDPPLPLARLRARGQLVELRAEDLRFTHGEAGELLAAGAGPALTEALVSALGERTEGWAAGLQLAALSLRGRADVPGFVAGFSGSNRYVLDYLTEEVLDGQPPELTTFLLESSVLDRLSGPLCDAVLGRTTASRCWSRSSGPTCSCCRWTGSGGGGGITTCSPTCCAPDCCAPLPIACPCCTAPQPRGWSGTACPTTLSALRSRAVTPTPRPASSRSTSRSTCGTATRPPPWSDG